MNKADSATSSFSTTTTLRKSASPMKSLVNLLTPGGLRRWSWGKRNLWPLPGWVRFGSLRRLTPICNDFGFTRGTPVDRYYIENFLAANAADVRGRVLEIGDNSYTLRYGGARVGKSDVLHVDPGNPLATFTGSLTDIPEIPSEAFDCVILTETLYLIYDFRAALCTIERILKPGGALLITFPGTNHQICHAEARMWGDYWRFTTWSAQKFLGEFFGDANVKTTSFGNVLVAISFLHGLAAEELTRQELDYNDDDYQMTVAARAVKPHTR
ncbi:MAG: class I SAM-dependent methyltransferase [Blastocatellia bacterium]